MKIMLSNRLVILFHDEDDMVAHVVKTEKSAQIRATSSISDTLLSAASHKCIPHVMLDRKALGEHEARNEFVTCST